MLPPTPNWQRAVRTQTERSPTLCAVTLLLASFVFATYVPHRIVSLSPDLTEMLYGIGAINRVVGVSNYDTYPPDIQKLPRLGQLDHPDLEKFAGLRPDL